MDTKKWTYLEDGQTAPRNSEWQERPGASPVEELTVLSDSLRELSVDRIEQKYRTLQSDWNDTVIGLRDLTASCAGRIPMPDGFFVGSAERSAAFAVVCRLLVGAEKHVYELRRLTAAGAALQTEAQGMFSAEALLEHRICAAKVHCRQRQDDPELMQAAEQIWQEFEAQRVRLREVYGAISSFCEAAVYFSSSVWSDFCNRMGNLADTLHEGAACDPRGAGQLCGELISFLDRTQAKSK